jgi:hypothetical protein
MREFRTQDGTIIHLPDTVQRSGMDTIPLEPCDCHVRLGNDFYFLPTGSCLRKDGKCNEDE